MRAPAARPGRFVRRPCDEDETGRELTPDQSLEGVTELYRLPVFDFLFPLGAQVGGLQFGIGESVVRHQGRRPVGLLMIEQEEAGVHETRQQDPARPKDPVAFPPNRADIRYEDSGNGIEDQIELQIIISVEIGNLLNLAELDLDCRRPFRRIVRTEIVPSSE